jgi:hypothetical protein
MRLEAINRLLRVDGTTVKARDVLSSAPYSDLVATLAFVIASLEGEVEEKHEANLGSAAQWASTTCNCQTDYTCVQHRPSKQKIEPIRGTHYHCENCGAEMEPKLRKAWTVKDGVSCLHICPKDGTEFWEKENDH